MLLTTVIFRSNNGRVCLFCHKPKHFLDFFTSFRWIFFWIQLFKPCTDPLHIKCSYIKSHFTYLLSYFHHYYISLQIEISLNFHSCFHQKIFYASKSWDMKQNTIKKEFIDSHWPLKEKENLKENKKSALT